MPTEENKEAGLVPGNDSKLIPFLLSAATSIAAAEGITDEEAAIKRANEIFEDAKLPEPLTEAGKQCFQTAQDTFAVQGTAQATQKPKFDYEALRNETTMVAMGEIIKAMGENSEFLPIRSKTTPEQEKASEEAYDRLTLAAFAALNSHNVGMKEFKYLFDSLKAIVSALEEHMMAQVIGHRHEIMSRLMGTKNPGTGKFDSNYVTYETLVATLNKVREDTGGNLDDYFNRSGDVEAPTEE